jgi:hypothetical protein
LQLHLREYTDVVHNSTIIEINSLNEIENEFLERTRVESEKDTGKEDSSRKNTEEKLLINNVNVNVNVVSLNCFWGSKTLFFH